MLKRIENWSSTDIKNPESDGLFAIFQSYKKRGNFLKAVRTGEYWLPTIFITKDDARWYLAKVIKTVKDEIRSGKRPKNNLNPDEALDFCILPVTLQYDESILEKRGWKL